MWHMYSVFEDLFGRQTMTTSTNEPLKHVVVGDKAAAAAKNKPQLRTTTTTSPISVSSPVSKSEPPASSPVISEVAAAVNSITVAANIVPSPPLPETTVSTPKDIIKPQIEDVQSFASTENNVPTFSPTLLSHSSPATKSSSPSSEKSLDNHPHHHLHEQQSRLFQQRESSSSSSEPLATNPLLDTIGGALASSNPDSDDSSDLDIVYQQLRYNRGRHRKQPQQEHMRIKTTHQRIHRHPQPGTTSDPEFIGYAGSNSIDSGYKSLCATPEVSDTLSAQEVRRSASDVSASDSSTTSGKPRSVNGSQQDAKIRMGTRSISSKLKPMDRSPRQVSVGSSMNDVTLDHLMYLRQSLRKDRSDMSRSDSIPSFRDSDLSSPRTATEEEWRDSRTSFHSTSNSPSSDSAFMGRSSRGSSRGDEVDQEGGGESSSDYLLSGVEYYDLESIQEFPPSNNYVTMLEEKTRCSRFKLISSPKCSEPITERQLNSMYRRRNESSQSVDGDIPRSHHHQQPQNIYGLAGHPSRIMRHTKLPSHHHPRPHHATDSKLTEAAIRVLEMIEDFRMEEAMTRSGRLVSYQGHGEPPQASASGANSRYPSLDLIQQTVMPRYRKNRSSSTRPASTGSLMEQEIDARSVASASSYAASAEHHVYEEIMYDLVCERGMPTHHMPPTERSRMAARSRLLPVPPHVARHHHQQQQGVPVDPRRMMVRSHKQRNTNMYSVLPNPHDRGNVDRFLEIEWQLSQERRGSLPPDFPV